MLSKGVHHPHAVLLGCTIHPHEPLCCPMLLHAARCCPGHAQAQGLLGMMLWRGEGFPSDRARAAALLAAACRGGDLPALRYALDPELRRAIATSTIPAAACRRASPTSPQSPVGCRPPAGQKEFQLGHMYASGEEGSMPRAPHACLEHPWACLMMA